MKKSDLLVALLGDIIPASDDGSLPSAASDSVVARMGAALDHDANMATVFEKGLSVLAALAGDAGDGDFIALNHSQRCGLIEKLREQEPSFFESLLTLTVRCYYQEPSVVSALGLEPRPPYPDGYKVEDWKPSLLEPVLAKKPFCRDA